MFLKDFVSLNSKSSSNIEYSVSINIINGLISRVSVLNKFNKKNLILYLSSGDSNLNKNYK